MHAKIKLTCKGFFSVPKYYYISRLPFQSLFAYDNRSTSHIFPKTYVSFKRLKQIAIHCSFVRNYLLQRTIVSLST